MTDETSTPSAPDEEEVPNIFRAKWTVDGAATLAEAAEKAHAFGNWLQGLHDEGYVLDGPVTDDYGSYRKPTETAR